MHKGQTFASPDTNFKVYLYLLVLAPTLLVVLVSNPGFFNHDELQKADHVLRFGLQDYFSHYVVLTQGAEFGVPVRPVSFFVQGLVSLLVPTFPFAVHLIDVFIHAVVACLTFRVMISFFNDRNLAWFTALIFLVNPLAMFSVGWSAALMDRLFVLFGLVALLAAIRIVQSGAKLSSFLVLLMAATLSVLSKETAIIFPGLMFLYCFITPGTFARPRFWSMFTVWALPGVSLILYRLPALLNTFQGNVSGPYESSVLNISDNIIVYFGYPFLITLQEAVNWVFQTQLQLYLALGCHLVLLLLLVYMFSFKVMITYLFSYLLFLVPVLTIPLKGAHYLYASALPISAALAFLLFKSWNKKQYLITVVSSSLLVMMIIHSFLNQIFVYRVGESMNTALKTAEAAYLATGKPVEMSVFTEPGSPSHILYRLATGREQLGKYYPVHIEVISTDSSDHQKADYVFDTDCRIYPILRQ
jgi:hypothetical protein